MTGWRITAPCSLPFLACISNRLTSWVTAIIGALRCPVGSPVTQYSRDGVLFQGQALPWTLTVPKNGLVQDGIVTVLHGVSVWLGNLHMGYPMLGSLALNFSILLFACQKTWSWPSRRLCIVIASQGQAMNEWMNELILCSSLQPSQFLKENTTSCVTPQGIALGWETGFHENSRHQSKSNWTIDLSG